MAGPKETFEMPSTKSEALMKRRGLSIAPAASSFWPKETSRARIASVGRHDAILFLTSGAVELNESVIGVHKCIDVVVTWKALDIFELLDDQGLKFTQVDSGALNHID